MLAAFHDARRSRHPWQYLVSRASIRFGVELPLAFRAASGFRLHLHDEPIAHALWLGMWDDSGLRRVCCDCLKPGDVAIDVGANIGHITLAMSRAIGPTGHVYAFEPIPKTCAHLKANLDLNGVSSVEAACVAVSNTTGESQFFIPWRRSTDQAGLRPISDADCQTCIRVPTLSLDDAAAEGWGKRRIALLKVGVEGAEYQVFLGAHRTLAQCDAVVFEHCSLNMLRMGLEGADVMDLLRSAGFFIYLCDPDSKRLVAAGEPAPDADYLAVRDVASFCANTGYATVDCLPDDLTPFVGPLSHDRARAGSRLAGGA